MQKVPADQAAARAAKYGFHHSAAGHGQGGQGAAALVARTLPGSSKTTTGPLAPPVAKANGSALQSQQQAQTGLVKMGGGGGGGSTALLPADLSSVPLLSTLPTPLPQLLLLLLPVFILKLSYIFPKRVIDPNTGGLLSPSWGEYFWLLVATLGWFHRVFGLPDGWALLNKALGVDEEGEEGARLPGGFNDADRTGLGAAEEQLPASATSSTSSDATLVHQADQHPMLAHVPGMVDEFLKLATQTDESEWESIVNAKEGGIVVQVWKYKKADYCFKMLYDLDTPLGVAVDFSADSLTRKEWDDMVDDIRILEIIDRMTRVEYVRAKPVFPTAARDVVLLSHLAAYPKEWNGDGEPASFMHVTKSVPHHAAPNPRGVVRMSTSVAGRIFTRLPNGGTRSLQIADLNPGGSVPNWVINFVASKAVPKSVGTMYAQMKKVGWQEGAPSRLWKEGLAGKGWTPQQVRTVGKSDSSASGVEVAVGPVPVAASSTVTSSSSSSSDSAEGGVLSTVVSALSTSVQTVHDALEWSTPFLVAAVAVAAMISMRNGDVRIEVGGRRR